jgi:uncharacterized membrane protein (DUF485 family)
MDNIDWEAVEHSPEFQELVRARRRFVVPATIFYLAWYLGFIALCGYAQDFMSRSVYEGLTVAYTLALTQFAMVVILGVLYVRRADNVSDPLRAKVRALVERMQQEAESTTTSETLEPRFVRPGTPAYSEEVQR